jgi:hypothetical protein
MTRVFARKCGSPQLADGRPALHQAPRTQCQCSQPAASVPVRRLLANVPCHITDYSYTATVPNVDSAAVYWHTPFLHRGPHSKHTLHMQRRPTRTRPCHANAQSTAKCEILHGSMLLILICRLISSRILSIAFLVHSEAASRRRQQTAAATMPDCMASGLGYGPMCSLPSQPWRPFVSGWWGSLRGACTTSHHH